MSKSLKVLFENQLYENGKPIGPLQLKENERSEKLRLIENFSGTEVNFKEVPIGQLKESELRPLTEKTGKGIILVLEGRFQMSDTKNQNKRIYPDTLWEKLLRPGSKQMQWASSGEMLGECDHPKDGETQMKRVVCMTTRFWRNIEDSKEILGRMVIFDTAAGRDLKAIHDGGGKLGVSSRGQGSLVRIEGVDVVQEDYELETWDIVYNPSTPGAYPGAVNEDAADPGKLKDKPADQSACHTLKTQDPAADAKIEHDDAQPRDLEPKSSDEQEVGISDPSAGTTRRPATAQEAADLLRGALPEEIPAGVLEAVKALRWAYRAAAKVEGPLYGHELAAIQEVARELAEEVADTSKKESTVDIEAIKKQVVDECTSKFQPLLESQAEKAVKATQEASEAKKIISEHSARMTAAKSVIEEMRNIILDLRSKLSEAESSLGAATKIAEALAEEVEFESLRGAVSGLAATHTKISGLSDSLSKATSVEEAVKITKGMLKESLPKVTREPLTERESEVNKACGISEATTKKLEESAAKDQIVEKRVDPKLAAAERIIAAGKAVGLK